MRSTAASTLQLALFDLDHTLIPFDSGMAWTQFLVEAGVLPASAPAAYLAQCQAYVDGTLDIHALHRATVAPLAAFAPAQLAQWGRAFEQQLAPRIPAAMRDLVRRHQQAGHLCAVVTATTRFVAEPVARLFGIAHVLATEPATADGLPGGAYTGEIAGLPCYREHKPTRVAQWLAARPAGGPAGVPDSAPATLAGFARSWFYSDSISDLPLLRCVTDPVAVRPEARLRATAAAAGWRIVDDGGLFNHTRPN